MNGDFSWLHFSDLHLTPEKNTSFDTTRAMQELRKSLEKGDLTADYVLITGDIAHKGDYTGTEKSFAVFLDALVKTGIDKKRIFWAVGNHDIQSRSLSWRNQVIEKIRKDDAEFITDSFWRSLKCEEELLLLNNGIKTYTERHKELLWDASASSSQIGHAFYPLDSLNLIVLNTCFTSYDDNDAGKLHVITDKLDEYSCHIDDKKPVFVIGHHGREWFLPIERTRLDYLFKDLNVDLYLCGHNHELGYGKITYSPYDIHQFTCGGLNSAATNFTFMRGQYDSSKSSVSIVPYTYRGSGWMCDYQLHPRLAEKSGFLLERLNQQKTGDESYRERLIEKKFNLSTPMQESSAPQVY
jgi:predicted phosphodiesterase